MAKNRLVNLFKTGFQYVGYLQVGNQFPEKFVKICPIFMLERILN
jgi:hypothetical protein